jgi:hypothetical protein
MRIFGGFGIRRPGHVTRPSNIRDFEFMNIPDYNNHPYFINISI